MNSKQPAAVHPGELRLFREVVDSGSVEAVAAQQGLDVDVVEAAVQVVFRFLGVDTLSDAQAKLSQDAPDPLDREIDFSGGQRGLHYLPSPSEGSVVTLDPDVAEAFRSSKAVNDALRAAMRAEKDARSA